MRHVKQRKTNLLTLIVFIITRNLAGLTHTHHKTTLESCLPHFIWTVNNKNRWLLWIKGAIPQNKVYEGDLLRNQRRLRLGGGSCFTLDSGRSDIWLECHYETTRRLAHRWICLLRQSREIDDWLAEHNSLPVARNSYKKYWKILKSKILQLFPCRWTLTDVLLGDCLNIQTLFSLNYI